MIAPDSPTLLCLISLFWPHLPPTVLISWNLLSLSSPTMILTCPFLVLLPWLSGDTWFYRVSVTPVSSVTSCTSVILIISLLREYKTESHGHYSPVSWFGSAEANIQSPPETVKGQRPEIRLFSLLPLCPALIKFVTNNTCLSLCCYWVETKPITLRWGVKTGLQLHKCPGWRPL